MKRMSPVGLLKQSSATGAVRFIGPLLDYLADPDAP